MTKLTRWLAAGMAAIVVVMTAGCGQAPASSAPAQEAALDAEGKLIFDHSLELEYAKNFAVDYYKGGYVLAKDGSGKMFLIVPEGKETPKGLAEGTVVLQAPLTNTCISNTPFASLIDSVGALDRVSLVSTEMDGWYLDNMVQAMKDQKIQFAGAYKSLDYERIAAQKTPLVVLPRTASTMPEVIDPLSELGIPVLYDHSSEEDHPLGRVEWVKLIGALFGMDEQAAKVFDAQKQKVEAIANANTGKTAAIFYTTSKGLSARNGGDYIAKMYELAGGVYINKDLNPDKTGTTSMSYEEFYASAQDADYIIYVCMGNRPKDIAELISYNELLGDFKAVKNGNVWLSSPNFYQSVGSIGTIIEDMNKIITDTSGSLQEVNHFYKIK